MPQRFHGNVSLFVANRTDSKPPIDAWRPYVDGEITLHFIDCAHENMMDPEPAAKIGSVLMDEITRLERPRNRQVRGEKT